MIIANLTGGLGNQMFQYSLGRHLTISNKCPLKLHFTSALFNIKREYELDVFNIRAELASDRELKQFGIVKNRIINRCLYLIDQKLNIKLNRHFVTDKYPYRYNPSILKLSGDLYLQGYWADERYFLNIQKQLRQDFTLKNKLDSQNLHTWRQIVSVNSVSLHVRRTDYITNKSNILKFIGIEYYRKSIASIAKKVNRPVFFVFSDDIAWCNENLRFPGKAHFIDNNRGKDSYKDMWLMSQCKYNIIANSSFSWWAAWLNNNKNKIVIKP